ncbi:MAG: hypothetical protein F6K18_19790 [Okeania sp. SIO2C2]|uniref:hypothetical protein n=1 Tax=Okeania sp. SIO2C2 TaxID=2607787 RepID=UPI0013B5F8BA|nr:hypothetical protein [Okeania sp. SIO2C2]NEP88897.1 hypothetical protein [Okeania sp. SIO2C2]
MNNRSHTNLNHERSFCKLNQKDTEIFQKNAEISQKDIQIKQALLLAIEMGLKLKFGDEYVEILSEISKIDDLKLLEALAELCVSDRFSNSSDLLNG